MVATQEHEELLGEHYNTLEQQHEAASLGMWLFLATEVMLFGGLFTGYTVYRFAYPLGFAEGSRHMDLTLGGINTFVLLVSSAIMALAVDAARTGKRAQLTRLLTVTAVLGIVFLAIKGIEYQHHFVEGLAPGLNWTYAGPRPQEVELFMVAYFTMTGLHAIHLTIAVALIAFMALRARRETHVPLKHTGYELLGLYWHFVDIIWVFLLPLLYLFGLQA